MVNYDDERNNTLRNNGWHTDNSCFAPTGCQDLEVKINQGHINRHVLHILYGASPMDILRLFYKLDADYYCQYCQLYPGIHNSCVKDKIQVKQDTIRKV